jgi:hypothetical protein
LSEVFPNELCASHGLTLLLQYLNDMETYEMTTLYSESTPAWAYPLLEVGGKGSHLLGLGRTACKSDRKFMDKGLYGQTILNQNGLA